MKKLQRAAVLTELCEKMRAKGSWCGETHLQKATYFLQELSGTSLDFDFTLYKYGPFSFGLRDEIREMHAEGLLTVQARDPYGSTFSPTQRALAIKKKFPKTVGRYSRAIDFVAAALGDKTAGELEQLGTTLYLSKKERVRDSARLARLLHEAKPHVDLDEAKVAAGELVRIVTSFDAGNP